jgi:hypothetical protein
MAGNVTLHPSMGRDGWLETVGKQEPARLPGCAAV